MNTHTSGLGVHHLRILFGPLYGADLSLPSRQIFFCVGDSVTGERPLGENLVHALNATPDSIYIPYRAGAANFKLKFDGIPDESGGNAGPAIGREYDFEIEFLSPDSVERRPAQYNTLCRFGDIVFAVKPENVPWSEEVSAFTRDCADQKEIDANPATPRGPHARRWSRTRLIAKMGAIILGGTALTALGYWQITRYQRAREVASVSNLLGRAPTPNLVLAGRDGAIHVLNASQDSVDWDKQALLKSDVRERVDVASLPAEQQRLERELDLRGFDFVTIRLDSPTHPELVLSSDSAHIVESAVKDLRQAAPYIQDVRVRTVGVTTLEQEARAALDAAGLRYRRLARENGATFDVSGALTDGELAQLQNLIGSFSRKWGTRRVDFKVAMRTDWLKGKSYREGGEGYMLVDHASWYFPQPLTGTP